jgi:hypothetical protein
MQNKVCKSILKQLRECQLAYDKKYPKVLRRVAIDFSNKHIHLIKLEGTINK